MRSTSGLLLFGLAIIVSMTIAMLFEAVTRFNSIGVFYGDRPIVIAFFVLIVTTCACQLADHMSEQMRVNKWCVYLMRSCVFFPFLLISFMIYDNVYPGRIMWHVIVPYFVVVAILMQLAVPAMLAIIMRDLGRLISPKVVSISNWIIYLSMPIPFLALIATIAMLLIGDFERVLNRWAWNAAIPIGVWSILVSVLICWLMVELRRSLSKIKRMLDYRDTADAVV